MTTKTIYDLKLHETIPLSNEATVTRVPGGWVYKFYCSVGYTSTFVPYHTEFIQYPDKF